MTLGLIVIWIIVISAFAVLAAWYAKKYNRSDALVGLFVTCVLFANLSASKIVEFHLPFGTIFAPAATLMFAVTFLLTDIVNEKFGRKDTQRMILIATVSQVALAIFSYIAIKATPAPFYLDQNAFEAILGNVPRVIVASWIAFFLSENVDAYLYQWFKKLTHDKHLWMRNALSSLPAMFVDSLVFIVLAFAGTVSIGPLILGQTLAKWIVGVIDIPFMYLARRVMK